MATFHLSSLGLPPGICVPVISPVPSPLQILQVSCLSINGVLLVFYCLWMAQCIERITQNYLLFNIQVIKTVNMKNGVSYAQLIKLCFICKSSKFYMKITIAFMYILDNI